MVDINTLLPMHLRREALIVQYGLPADATEDDVVTAIHKDLCAKYGLPLTATDEEIERRIFEARCKTFHLDPANATEAQLDALSAALTRKKAA